MFFSPSPSSTPTQYFHAHLFVFRSLLAVLLLLFIPPPPQADPFSIEIRFYSLVMSFLAFLFFRNHEGKPMENPGKNCLLLDTPDAPPYIDLHLA